MRYVYLFIISLLFISCESELDFNYHSVESQLVIEGMVSESGARIALSKTIPMADSLNVSYISNATVLLTDVTENVTRQLASNNEDLFVDDVPGIVGHEYKLEVQYDGNSYTANSIMPSPSQILALNFQWIKMPYDYVAVLQVVFTDSDEVGDHYWIQVFRNSKPYLWILSDDRSAVNGVITEVTMTSRQDTAEEDEKTVLLDGDEISVTISPISLSMYDYLTAVQSSSNGSSMFSGQYCLGYFLAAPIATASMIYRPDEMTEYK